MMIQPKFAANDEADEPAQKFGQKTNEPMTELVCTSAIVQNRNLNSRMSSVTTIANTPSLDASFLFRRSSPWPKRRSKRIGSRSS